MPAVTGRAGGWQTATVVGASLLTETARALVLSAPGFQESLPGQHIDVRLTAPDGYQASRSYSLAATGVPERVDLVVDRVPGGEVSSYLVDVARPGDQLEVRGPLGGYFVWDETDPSPVLLVAGGSGVVPLLAMWRARRGSRSNAPFLLVSSARSPEGAIARAEIDHSDPDLGVRWVFTRSAPPGWPSAPRRLATEDLDAVGFGPDDHTSIFVCGPNGFVETATSLLTALGHAASRIRTERFGGAQ